MVSPHSIKTGQASSMDLVEGPESIPPQEVNSASVLPEDSTLSLADFLLWRTTQADFASPPAGQERPRQGLVQAPHPHPDP